MRNLIYLLLVFVLFSCGKQDELGVIYQSKQLAENWEFSEQGKDEWLPAKVPGSVHMDLFHNQQIDDPFFENNEPKQRWIETKNWTYRTTFEVDSLNLSSQRNSLKFDGLDTYAEVYLNGTLILTANNMFRSWEVTVRHLLQLGANELIIKFESPVLHNKKTV